MRAKIAAVREALVENYRQYCDLNERLRELQEECTHEEGYAPSEHFDGLEYCVICRAPRIPE